MNKTEAQEICRIINVINQNGLGYILGSSFVSKNTDTELLRLLEKNGISFKSKNLEDVIEVIDTVLQITCAGHASFDSNNKNITIESKLNNGSSLPWVAVVDEFLHKQGYKTRKVLHNHSQKGEKVHIKLIQK
jgi:hypothetical protein